MPFLETNDGTILYLIQTIVEYFDSISKDNKLYPTGGPERFYVLLRLDIDDNLFELSMQITMKIWQGESARRPDLFAWLWPNITRYFDLSECKSDRSRSFDIGDVDLLQGISYLDTMVTRNDNLPDNPCHDWQENWPKMAA